MNDYIVVKGARQHNLKNLNLNIPKNKLVVFSGVSGSGKSSLAMDTLYAEGQRRYVESLSTYARQFLGMLPRPEVDSIEGLSPAVAIDQHSLSHNPRSTVGTVTEIYDYFRVLFARVGHPHCPQCGREIGRNSAQAIFEHLIKLARENLVLPENKQLRWLILAPLIKDKRGEYGQLFANLRKKGYQQVRVDGWLYSLSEEPVLIKTNRHHIEAVVDRLVITKKKLSEEVFLQRCKNSVEIALDLADGALILAQVKDATFDFPTQPQKMTDTLFSSRFACPDCDLSMTEVEPRLFSFNSPFGACPECNGLGVKLKIDTTRVSPWGAEELSRRYYTTTSDEIREEIEKLMIKELCPVCQGQRLKPEALKVTLDTFSIAQISDFSLDHLLVWLKKWFTTLEEKQEKEIATPLVKEIVQRLTFLLTVGVEYLTLARAAATLSAGEGQRIRLASQVGSGLSGVLYILDEPTVGLHPRDTQRLITTLKKLRDLGNTLIVVEHDEEVVNQADWVMDFGLLAGKEGGYLVAEGSPQKVARDPRSLTGKYLSGRVNLNLDDHVKIDAHTQWLELLGCREHNLKNITVRFPLGALSVVTGVSGSGKSTLVSDTLYPALKNQLLGDRRHQPGVFDQLKGVEAVQQVLLVDQLPIGRTSRSNPATYTGIFTDIRQILAQTREAKLRGFTESFFSFNTGNGRCEVCEGQGLIRVHMQFMSDLWVECEECHGRRFKPEILEVQYQDKNVAEILDLTIREALIFFAPFSKIERKLMVLQHIGLDYLTLGQRSPTLSGGESQRLKLARELVKKTKERSVYLLDEPTTGLHFADLKKLLVVLRALVHRGDTVIVIEHNLAFIRQADWLLDLGPEGGEAGGYLVTEGRPSEVAQHSTSWTGRYLRLK